MKREAWNHPKIKLLCRDLKLPLCYGVGVLESLWIVTGKNFPSGDIGRWSNEEIAVAIDYPGDPDELIAALVRRKLLEEIDLPGRLGVHDWHEHADSHVHTCLAKRTQFFWNGTEPNISHDAFNWHTRSRIEAEYAKLRDGTSPGPVPDQSGTCTGQVRALPEPEPEPEPEPVKTTTTDKCCTGIQESPANEHPLPQPVVRFVEFPKTTEAVCSRFPTADVVLVGRIVEASFRAYLEIDSPKIPEPDDSVFAAAVEAAAKESKKQTSAALFLRTVPAVIRNWAKCGRNGAGGVPTSRSLKAIREENEAHRRSLAYA